MTADASEGRGSADTVEAEVNRRLRLVDWRFLAGRPRSTLACCRADAELAAAVAAVVDEIADDEGAIDCDLAVGQDPSPSEVGELYAALGPGGTCYTEWTRRRPADGVRVLESAGFVDVACYRRVLGADGLPLAWVPLDAPGATRFMAGRLRLSGGRLRRAAAAARRRLSDLVRGRWRHPFCALARRPGPQPGSGREPAAWLRAGWEGWDLGARPERLSTLLLTGGPRSVSKIVLLAFAEPDPVPRIAVKAARVEGAADGLRREASVLDQLTRRGAPPGVPRFLFHREPSGVPLVGETALEGRPLQNQLSASNHRTWALRVTNWLSDLADAGTVSPARAWRTPVVEPVLRTFEAQYGTVADAALLRAAADAVRSIESLPVVPEQRDFGPWNLLETPDSELGVLDWESALVEGLPALDLIYYLAYASFTVDGAHDHDARIASYRRQLDPATPTGAVRRECLERYAGALDLPPDHLRPLGILAWMIHAASDYRHAAADAGGVPDPSRLSRGLFLGLWREDLRHMDGGHRDGRPVEGAPFKPDH